MRVQKSIKYLSILVVLLILTILVSSKPGLAQNQQTTTTTTTEAALLDVPVITSEQQRWVVRVYFQDRSQVEQIAAWKEPWEVDDKTGYLIIDVSTDELNWLVSQGYQIEVDSSLTEQINHPPEALPNQISGIPGYPCYRTVEETFLTAGNIATNYPNLAEWIDIGDSWEKVTPGGSAGYDMMVLRLTNEAIGGSKPKLFAMSSIHAREYAPAELNTRFAEYLIANYGVDADVTWILDYTEIYLLLESNPDGRKHAESGNYWRKNTNENYCSPTSSNRGADLNRNFAFEWGCCNGSSSYSCDETYRGPSAGSEPEVQAIQTFVRSIFPDQRGSSLSDPAPDNAMGIFLDLHSYSELVLWPWGFTANVAPNGTQLQTLGRKFAFFNDYEPDQSIGLYPTDGTTDDFAYGELGVAAYVFEMGTAFFQSCSTFENTILPDNLPALLYAAKTARTPYITPSGPDALDVTISPNDVVPGSVITLETTLNDTRYNNVNGIEPYQNVAAAAYYVDTPPWETGAVTHTLSAADGYFNTSVEDVLGTIDTTGFSSGRHIVYVRGQDTNGAWGVVSAAFFYIADPTTSSVIQGYVHESGTELPLDALISSSQGFETQTDPLTGFYQMYVISGTHELTASAANHIPQVVSGLSVYDNQTLNQDFTLETICAAFADDFESSNGGWTAESLWSLTQENNHSSSHSWTDSPGEDYMDEQDVSLISPLIDLTDYEDVSLDFWQICSTEADYDFCFVEVSNDGGATWSQLASYDGPHSQWENIHLAAPMLDHQTSVRIRFRLVSDFYKTADGWHVDDVRILGSGQGCGVNDLPLKYFLPIMQK